MMKAMIEQQKKTGHAMAMDHHGNGVTVLPGETATLVWTFARAANLQFACDIPPATTRTACTGRSASRRQ